MAANRAEQVTLVTAGMDAAPYAQGAREVEQANARMAQSARGLAQQGEQTQRTVANTARGFDALVRRLDDSARAAYEFGRAQAQIQRGLDAGRVSQERANQLLDLARQRFLGIKPAAEGATESLRLHGYQIQNLTAQATDFAVQAGSGGGIFRPLLQQGPQAVDAVGGIGNAFRLLRQNAAPLAAGGIIAGVGVALAAMAVSAENNQRSVNGVATGLQRTRSDYQQAAGEINTAARRLAETTTIGTDEARKALSTLAEVPGFRTTQENLVETGRLARDLGAAFREDTASGAERLADALRDPAAAARRYFEDGREGIRGFDADFVRHIELLQSSGRQTEAAAAVVGRFRQSLRDAEEATTPLQRSLNNLGNTLERIWNGAGNGSRSIGSVLTDGLAGAVGKVNEAVEALERLQRAQAGNSYLREFFRGYGRQNAPAGGAAPAGLGGYGPNGEDELAAEGRRIAATRSAGGNLPGVPADMQGHIAAAAARANLDPALLARVYGAEAVRNPDGTFRDSSAGAVGPLQLMPGTYADLARRHGLDPNGIRDPGQNAAAGALYLRERLDARGGDVGAALADYNAGPARMEAVRAGRATMPEETRRYVDRIQGPGSAGPLAEPDPERQRSADLQAYRERGGGNAYQRERIEAELGAARDNLAGSAPGSDAARDFANQVEDLQGKLERLKPAQDQFVEALRRQNEAGADLDPTMRAVREAVAQFDQAMRMQGKDGNAPEVAAARARVVQETLRGLTQEYQQQNSEIDRNAASQRRIAAAWEGGAQAASHQASVERALVDVQRSGIVGDEARARAVEELARKYDDLAKSAGAARVAQQRDRTRQAIEDTRAEIGEVGLSETERNRRRAERSAQRNLENTPGAPDPNSAEGQGIVKQAGQLSEYRDQLDRAEDAWRELQNVGSQAIDRLGTGLVDLLSTGKWNDFRSTASGVLKDLAGDFLKLGALNPLKNALFGTNLGTLGDLGGGTGGGGLVGEAAKGIGSWFKGLFSSGATAAVAHTGGLAGDGSLPSRHVPASVFHEAPRYHSGGVAGWSPWVGSDEIPTILRRNELVLTEPQQRAVRGRIGAGAGAAAVVLHAPVTIATPDAESFRASAGQVRADWGRTLRRAARNL